MESRNMPVKKSVLETGSRPPEEMIWPFRPAASEPSWVTSSTLSKLRAVAVLGIALLGSACQKEAPPAAAPPANAAKETDLKTFLVNGIIRKLDPTELSATIQHEEIRDYMPAMTMPFSVKNTNELAGLQPGDPVVFRLNVTENDSWIDKLKKASAPASEEPPQRAPVRIVRNVEELKVGDLIPDYPFTNQFGQKITLGQFKGQALALTFIFTRCPLPNFCPLMSKNFSEVYKVLSAKSEAPTNWHLLTISFDPHHDTPAALKRYAERYEYNPKKWSFLTGAMIEIDAITDQFNLAISVQNDQWDHKLRTAVIDTQGRVQKIFIGNQWKPEELVEEILRAAEPK
jgi:protein SCO1/2